MLCKISTKNLYKKLKQKFKNTKETPKTQNTMETTIKNPEIITQYGEVNSGYIMFGFLADSAKNLKETIALDIISTILGGGKSSRLHTNLIEKAEKPHYFGVDTSHFQFKDGDNFFIEANFDADKKDTVIEELKSHFNKVAGIPIMPRVINSNMLITNEYTINNVPIGIEIKNYFMI